ncbi:MAG: cupredoxin domain-containing protein [Pyrinomonadaceae bacterium]
MKRLIIVLMAALCCAAVIAATQPRSKEKPKVAEGAATVTVSNSKFEPKTLTVRAGTTVTWENKEGAHTVIADRSGQFESDTLTAGGTFSHKFTRPGRYPYYCSFHGAKGGHDMAGTIVVVK